MLIEDSLLILLALHVALALSIGRPALFVLLTALLLPPLLLLSALLILPLAFSLALLVLRLALIATPLLFSLAALLIIVAALLLVLRLLLGIFISFVTIASIILGAHEDGRTQAERQNQ